jgi:hypothetical protein
MVWLAYLINPRETKPGAAPYTKQPGSGPDDGWVSTNLSAELFISLRGRGFVGDQ